MLTKLSLITRNTQNSDLTNIGLGSLHCFLLHQQKPLSLMMPPLPLRLLLPLLPPLVTVQLLE
ncbi:hypothetical protein LINGRAHAP2_LOCUS4037 [Linum grandiflorum]